MADTNYYRTQFLEKYSEFLSQIKIMYPKKDSDVHVRVLSLEKLDEEKRLDYGQKFNNCINKSTTHKNYLMSRKIKLFSAKNEDTKNISYSLLNTIPLKKLLNGNLNENSKNVIWEFIQLLFVFSELSNKEKSNLNKSYIRDLLKCVEDNHAKPDKPEPKQVEKRSAPNSNDQNILNLDVNPETNNMINDIVSLFQEGMDDGADANPFKNIVEVTKKITENYQNKIEKGDIDLDGLLKSIQKTMPDMPDISNLDLEGKTEEEIKHIIDENFSTADVELGDKEKKEGSGSGMDLGGMMKMMGKMTESLGGGGGKDGEPDMGNLNKLMESMGGFKMPESEEEAKEHSDKMRKILETDFNMDLSELDKLKDDLENKGGEDEMNENDFQKITDVMGNMLKDIQEDESKSKTEK
ncbi:hypothetical protein CPAV1605_383 [seawater metagenome]|uniref:Uncharacterized protein n=1 Tax=seawater metagenome TaxID=1561972 RepID=A0A5E8CGV9_9ZZZZ